MSKKNGRLALLVMSIACVLSLTMGMLTFNGAVSKANADATVYYSADFTGVPNNADGADKIYQHTGIAGGNRTIVTAVPNYIQAIYTFYDNGCQHVNVYQDTNRGIPSTDTDKTYNLHMIYRHFGYIKDTTIGLKGPTSDYDSVLVINAAGDVFVSNYGAQKYVNLVSATKTTDGWYDIELTFEGTGGYLFPIFWMNTNDYEKANAELNTGFDLAEFRVTCGDSVVYDLEVPQGLEGEAAIFGACGFAGAPHAFRTVAGVDGINGDTLRVTYTFWDNGFQQNELYSDTNAINITFEKGQKYVIEFDTKLFGSANENYLMVRQLDAANGYAQLAEAQAIVRGNGSYLFADYGSGENHILNEDLSVITNENGLFHVKMVVTGMGHRFQLIGRMHCTDYAGANANDDTGMFIDNLKIYDYATETPDPGVDPEPPVEDEKYDVVYSQDFNQVPASTSGGDAMYNACGFAGNLNSLTIDAEGVNGTKALKAIYGYWENGGWQTVELYTDTGKVNVLLEEGKEYIFEFKAKSLGSIFQNILVFRQLDPNNGWAKKGEVQAILNADGTVSFADAAGWDSSLTASLNAEASSYTVDENGVCTVKMAVKGLGYRFMLIGNSCSSDPVASNANGDTGLLLDDFKIMTEKEEKPEPEIDVSGEYKATYGQTFEGTDPTTSGSDAMFHATGFAGAVPALTIESENAISGKQSLKAVYGFYEDGGWQAGNVYLDSSRTTNTNMDTIYRIIMKVKPFGSWARFAVGFAMGTDNLNETVQITPDGEIMLEKAYGGRMIDATVTVNEGVYEITVYTFGTGGYIFNYFHMQSSDPASANANGDTGFYLDDYNFAKQLKAEGAGLNLKATFYNKAIGGDLVTMATFNEIASVAIGEKVLTEGEYTYENGKLAIKESVMKALAKGEHVITVSSGDKAELKVLVDDVYMGVVYSNDFAAMPDLNGGSEAKDNFFFNSYMDPAIYDLYTVDENDNRMIKFVKGEVSDISQRMFQTNPQTGRLNMLYKDRWNSVAIDLKPVNGSAISVNCNIFDNFVDTPWFFMEIDLATGKRIDDGVQGSDVNWYVVDKGDGWYTLTVTFRYTGEQYSNTASAYVYFGAAQLQADTCYYLDNFVASTELVPYYVNGKDNYDVASKELPYAIVDLGRVFEVTQIKAGEKVLVAGVDYSSETTPLGYERINFAKSAFEGLNLGDSVNVEITTSKGNVITRVVTVIDTTPTAPERVEADIAEDKALSVNVDLKGYEISLIKAGETDLIGTEYNFNEAQSTIEFKHTYLKTLAVGEYVYEVKTTSGASVKFTLVIINSTPTMADATYEKSEGGDLVVEVNLMGKELVSVTLGEFTLNSDEYSYADGRLTILETVVAGLNAGEYNLIVTTIASVTVKLTVNDAPPVFSGEYQATVGEDLVITVEIYGKDIVSVVVDGLELREGEYSYADGKLTIAGEVFAELALGQRELVLTTAGGQATITFTLNASQGGGSSEEKPAPAPSCASSLVGSWTVILSAFAVAFLFKKRK